MSINNNDDYCPNGKSLYGAISARIVNTIVKAIEEFPVKTHLDVAIIGYALSYTIHDASLKILQENLPFLEGLCAIDEEGKSILGEACLHTALWGVEEPTKNIREHFLEMLFKAMLISADCKEATDENS